ncbi:MAG: hypothetical protein PVH77_10990 [Phycisphaerales bacterium]|jgi:hypothetical protein
MCAKSSCVVFIVFALSVATVTSGVQIGDFENDLTGWSVVEPNVTTSFSTTGATTGQNGLRIESLTGLQDVAVFDLYGQGMINEFRNNLKASIDVTRLLSDWTDQGGSWCDIYMAVRAGSNDPESAESTWEFRGDMEGDADWWAALGDETMTFEYDYSLALNEIDFYNLEYLELIVVTNWGGFEPGGVYYIDNVQIYGGGPAYDPEPVDGARDVSRVTTLSWTSGVYADTHDIYFGTDLDDVNNATRDNPLGVLVGQDETANTYNPGSLMSGENYFWRIDEVSGPNIWKGEVWSFTTAYANEGYVIGDWENNMDNWVLFSGSDAILSYSPTGATLNENSLKVDVTESYWVIRLDLNPAQIAALKENDLFTMDVTWVNSEWAGQSWAQMHKVAINSAATGWSEIETPISDTGNPDDPGSWAPSDSIDIDTRTLVWDYSGINVADIEDNGWTQLHISQNHDSSIVGTYYFDNARFMNSKLASEPNPANRTTDVKTDPTLSWKAGRTAATHNLYLGTNLSDINDVNTDNLADYPDVIFANVDVASFKPGTLAFNTEYYWRVDEVNNAEPDVRWKGNIWRFTIGNYIVLDDFEDYNDYEPDRIFDAWIDGYGDSTNGSTIGYPEPDFASGEHFVETSIVHGGSQSMPYFYNNSTAGNSEAALTLESSRDWTENSIDKLTLWFRGYPAEVGSFTENPAGTYTITASGSDIWGREDGFHYAFRELTGVGSITARVDSVTNTDPWAKAGVMIRNTLEPGSSHAMMAVTPGQGVSYQRRIMSGDVTVETTEPGITAPIWVKVERDIGGNYMASYSSDGSTWTQLDSNLVTMNSTVKIGLAVTSHNAGATCEAVFSNVSTTGNVGQQWSNQDIGITSNISAPMYVALNDSAVVYHDNPDASLIGEWTQWSIDLQKFADQGVDLTNVEKIGIGFGDRNNPQAGGSGVVYFDDIRLLLP